ncbi:MAG: ABC transporter ATP-binding protein [Gordonibacter sp.]|uniref:ABC transporter ATP-binding protein n=1 Tax=Gordonibacter sp. TaxID=1968902 RepID=UPI002FC9135B
MRDNEVQPTSPVLAVEGVVKTFGSKRAVNEVSLEVMPGDIFGFVGHNGAGKTTLIRSIVGVSSYDAGDIRIMGRSVRTDPLSCKRAVAYVPDNPDIYEFLTGIQYLNYIADIFEVPAAMRRQRIRAYADRFALTEALGDLVSSYSHGMRQKLALIGALMHEPKLLVLDEPFVGLDPEASFNMKEMLRELAERGSAVFFSSHVLEVVEKLCNKVAIIKQGALRACGPTAEVVGDESLEDVFLDMLEQDARAAEVGRPGAATTDARLSRQPGEGTPEAGRPGAVAQPARSSKRVGRGR